MTPYGLHGSIRAIQGQGDALEAVLLEAAKGVETAGGCLLYLVSRTPDDPELVWVTEVWTDRAAHTASLQQPAAIALIARARPLFAGMGDRSEFRPVGGLGLTL